MAVMPDAPVAPKATIYDQIIADFKREKNAWCKNNFHHYDGKSVSACLVGGVERACGVAYIKPNGKSFATKDRRKVLRAARIIDHLADLIYPGGRHTECDNDIENDNRYLGGLPSPTYTPFGENGGITDPGDSAGSREAAGAGTVYDFNDDEGTEKADVIRLLKKAAKAFPND